MFPSLLNVALRFLVLSLVFVNTGCWSDTATFVPPQSEGEKNLTLIPEDIDSVSAVSEGRSNQSTDEVLDLNGAKAQRIILKNNLEVILLSSPTSKSAAAALGVKVGSKSDPAGKEGLAHYLEHMLFLGTEDFPVVGEYGEYIKKNGGRNNAYTAPHLTNYFFEVLPDGYEGAIQRFSSFFKSPLFDKTFAEKEKNAVNEEFSFRGDLWKPWRAASGFYSQENPGHFSIGSLETLKDVKVEDTVAFYKKHYFAEAMTLSLVGPFSLEELKELAHKYFSDIPSRPDAKLNSYPMYMSFDLAKLPAEILVAQNKGEKKLTLFFPVSKPRHTNPSILGLMGSLVGDEGPDSLMTQLQRRGWVQPGNNNLSAAASSDGLNIELEITDKGLESRQELVQEVIDYLEKLRSYSFPQALLEEVILLNEGQSYLKSFFEVSSSSASGIVASLNQLTPDSLTWKEAILNRDLKVASSEDYFDFLNRVELKKPLVSVVHPSFSEVNMDYQAYTHMDQGGVYLDTAKNGQEVVVDSAFGWAFAVNKLDLTQGGNSSLLVALPEQSLFLPESFEIFPETLEKNLTVSGEFGKINLNQFPDNPLPWTEFSAAIYSSDFDPDDPSTGLFFDVVSEMINFEFGRLFYPAIRSNYSFSAEPSTIRAALILKFSGWSDQYLERFNRITQSVDLSFDSQEFELAKTIMVRNLQRETQAGPTNIAFGTLVASLGHSRLSVPQKIIALEKYSFDKFEQQLEIFKKSAAQISNLSGNLKKDFATSFAQTLSTNWELQWDFKNNPELPLRKYKFPAQKVQELQSPSAENGTYLGYWDLGAINQKSPARFYSQAITTWLSKAYYQELRTVQQLAYSLGALPIDLFGHSGLGYYIESSHPMEKIQQASDDFFSRWVKDFGSNTTQKQVDQVMGNIVEQNSYPADNSERHKWLFNWRLNGYASNEAVEEFLNSALSTKVETLQRFLESQVEDQTEPSVSIRVIKN